MRTPAVGLAATLAVALMSFPALNARVLAAGDVSAPNVVKQTNDVRSRNGLGLLNIDPLLMRAAQAKADDMAARGYFAHQTPDGRMPWDWIAAVGYDFAAAAENLAVGYPTDADLISAWMESEGHRHNLLNQKYTDIGIGIARGRYKGQDTIFVVQMFGKPRIARPAVVLAATPIPIGPGAAPSLPLEATDLDVRVAPLAEVPLDASALPVEPATVASPALEADPVDVEPSALPALALPSADILFEPLPLPAVPLMATDLSVECVLAPPAPQPLIQRALAVRPLH